MARKIPKDSSVAEWSANRYVESDPDVSLIKTGFLNTPLFLPISNDRRVCFEHHKLYADWKYSELFSSPQIISDLSKPSGRISDAVIMTAPANHWHYIVDGLANLSESILSRCDHVFVDGNLSEDQVSFLNIYANTLTGKNITVDRLTGTTYSLRNVLVPTNKPFASKVAAFRAVLDRIEDLPRHPDAKKRIYISRKNADTRQLVNEEELLSMLQSEFDFHSILNENYSIIDQISIYRHADIVMGPHGAGLTDILFSKTPSLLAEMFNRVQQPFYQVLAQAMGIGYLGVPGTPARPDNDPYRADNAPFSVDVTGVREALGKMLG